MLAVRRWKYRCMHRHIASVDDEEVEVKVSSARTLWSLRSNIPFLAMIPTDPVSRVATSELLRISQTSDKPVLDNSPASLVYPSFSYTGDLKPRKCIALIMRRSRYARLIVS